MPSNAGSLQESVLLIIIAIILLAGWLLEPRGR